MGCQKTQPLDEAFLWFCIRYVERNPVRAGMVERAEDYRWSSTRGHCGLADDGLVTSNANHWKAFQGIENWSAWLAEEQDEERLNVVRRNVQKNLPCGSGAFVTGLERHLRTPEEMAAYLEACLEEADGDAAFVAKALGDIARAKGMSQVARDAGLSRESLYKALSGERSPGFDTILKVIRALGLKLHAEPALVACSAAQQGAPADARTSRG